MTVKGADTLYIGSCKYNVLKIERSESHRAHPPVFVGTDYYSPELKLILAKEIRKNNGGYDRIYALKRAEIKTRRRTSRPTGETRDNWSIRSSRCLMP